MPITHLDAAGKAHMVDISEKPATKRTAVAEGHVAMSPAALKATRGATAAKGDVLAVARIAGISAAKRTSDLIPLCHPLPLTAISIDFEFEPGGVRVAATASTTWGTGVEMEAMTATSVALLTIYDMLKAVDKAMVISGVRLLRKSGGKSGTWTAPAA